MLKDYLKLIRLDKPIGSLLLLWPTLWALWLASYGMPNVRILLVFILGVFLTRSAGCAFNDFFDAKFDKYVSRTKNRPLASGVIARWEAILVGSILTIIAFVLALTNLTTTTILLSIAAAALYITYPLFKRFFPLPQAYMGLAYSFGIPMVFMQIQNTLTLNVLLLMLANILWAIGYDTIYALVDIEDDLKIGIKTSAITFGKHVNFMVGMCFLTFIAIMCYIGITFTLNMFYWLGIITAASLLLKQLRVLYLQQKERYFSMFLLNNWVGVAIFVGIVLSFTSYYLHLFHYILHHNLLNLSP